MSAEQPGAADRCPYPPPLPMTGAVHAGAVRRKVGVRATAALRLRRRTPPCMVPPFAPRSAPIAAGGIQARPSTTLTRRWVRRSRSQAATSCEGAPLVVVLAGPVPPKRQAPADSPNEVARTRGRLAAAIAPSRPFLAVPGARPEELVAYLADTPERADARTPCGAAPTQYNAVRRSERAALLWAAGVGGRRSGRGDLIGTSVGAGTPGTGGRPPSLRRRGRRSRLTEGRQAESRCVGVDHRLRKAMPDDQTCSVGIAVYDGDENPESLVARADAALYDAKRCARNRTALRRESST